MYDALSDDIHDTNDWDRGFSVKMKPWDCSFIGIWISTRNERNRKGYIFGYLCVLLSQHYCLRVAPPYPSLSWELYEKGSLYNITAQETGKLAFLQMGAL